MYIKHFLKLQDIVIFANKTYYLTIKLALDWCNLIFFSFKISIFYLFTFCCVEWPLICHLYCIH